jgi:hypothetical protein
MLNVSVYQLQKIQDVTEEAKLCLLTTLLSVLRFAGNLKVELINRLCKDQKNWAWSFFLGFSWFPVCRTG